MDLCPRKLLRRLASAMCAVAVCVCLGSGARAEEGDGGMASSETSSKADFVGAETCLACHEGQASFKNSIHAKAWPKAKGIEFEKSCETCHGAGSLHAAAAGDKSNPGFASIRNPKHDPASAVNASCLSCHEKGGQAHWNEGAHAGRGLSCLSCHSVHEGHGKANLKKAAVEDNCFECHKNVRTEIKKFSHHPIMEGKVSCSDCHNPHGTLGEKMLTGETVNTTCFQCHAEKRGPYLWEHRPVSEDCSTCHTPHGSNHDKLLVQKVPYLCQTCHSGQRHPGALLTSPVGQAGTTNQILGNRGGSYKSCLNCHQQVHGSNHPSGGRFVR